MTKPNLAYAAVRKDRYTDEEFLDTASVSAVKCIVELSAQRVRDRMPGWNHAHPFVRIARIMIEEVTEAEAQRIEAAARGLVVDLTSRHRGTAA